MEKQQSFNLIEGEFNPAEAKHILFELVRSKIQFHSTESFGITVRTSGDISFHENRIKQLNQTNRDIGTLMEYAAENKLRLKIQSSIEISLINERG